MDDLINFLRDLTKVPRASDIRLKLETRSGLITARVHAQKDTIRFSIPEDLQGRWEAITRFLLPKRPDKIVDVEYEDFAEITYQDEPSAEAVGEEDTPALGPVRTIRFRASLSSNIQGEELVMRILPEKIPDPEEILLPPRLVEMFTTVWEDGVVLFVGQTGSGKTTSIASLVKARAMKRDQMVITLEDPVEYVYPSNLGGTESDFSMRQVGRNTRSFATGLRAAVRMRPDVIVVGEIRDSQAAATTLSAGMAGCLVVGTLHATNAFQGPQRLFSFIDNEESGMSGSIGLEVIGSTLRAVVAQRLIRNHQDGTIVAIHEILTQTSAVTGKINEGKFRSLIHDMETGSAHGMQLFRQALEKRVADKLLPPTVTQPGV